LRVLFAPADYQGTAYYRMFLPYQAVKDVFSCTYRLNIRERDRDFQEADLVVLQRQHYPATVELVKNYKKEKVFIFELDDNYWDIGCDIVAEYWTPQKLKIMEEIMSECHMVTTSTEPLVDLLTKFNPNVEVVPNFVIDPQQEVVPPKKKSDTLRIGWAGGTAHMVDFTPDIISAIKTTRRLYRDKVQFVFLGYVPPELVGHVYYHEFVNPEKWISSLHSMALDIGIIPCSDTPFNKYKSNLKFLEYSHAGIASIASAIDPYTRNIPNKCLIRVDKKNSYQSWLNAMTRLIKDTELRYRIAGDAKQFVRHNFLWEKHKKYFEQVYRSAFLKYSNSL